jgi:hypothetical protein
MSFVMSDRVCSTIQVMGSRTFDRSASMPLVDHAAASPVTNRQLSSRARSFGHPQAGLRYSALEDPPRSGAELSSLFGEEGRPTECTPLLSHSRRRHRPGRKPQHKSASRQQFQKERPRSAPRRSWLQTPISSRHLLTREGAPQAGKWWCAGEAANGPGAVSGRRTRCAPSRK